MKWYTPIVFAAFTAMPAFSGFAQVSFKTVAPQHPLRPGESFQVQYIIDNAGEVSDFLLPTFTDFKVVAGPNLYVNNGSASQKNLVITLACTRQGTFKIPGASCIANGKQIKSNDVFVKVILPSELDESAYFLRPGEDPIEKIRQNLFLQLHVDKESCYVGEPLVATFKLYSRLQSKSNVIKNSGFYGFSVYDMVNVNDKIESEEKLNGHWFEVHTVRKVQLYPLQQGSFTIDAMELANVVEFSKSTVNKRTEQQVNEDMYNSDEAQTKTAAGAQVYQVNVSSRPVVVKVKPLPGNSIPDTFSGAVGSFSIRAFFEKDTLARNEEGSLVVEVNGSGNFQRVNAPLISWPPGLEGFEASVKDTLNKEQVPLAGQRRFRYVFVANKSGYFVIPPVSFGFFDLKAKAYKTISSGRLTVLVEGTHHDLNSFINKLIPRGRKSRSTPWQLILFSLLLLTAILLRWNSRRVNKRSSRRTNSQQPGASPFSINEILMRADSKVDSDNKTFCNELNLAVGSYFDLRLFSHHKMAKSELARLLIERGAADDVVEDLLKILDQCETQMYTNADMILDKTDLLENTRRILNEIDTQLKV